MLTKLHIGCGDKKIPGAEWTSVDVRALPGADIVTDLGDLRMFMDNTVDMIYCCHALEHVSHPEALLALKEWSRVLRSQSGRLLVCVPDIGAICRLVAEGSHLGRMRGLIWGAQNYQENTHYTGWDFEELATDLRACGFFNIVRFDAWERLKPNVPPVYRDFAFMKMNGIPCSLNVEAIAR